MVMVNLEELPLFKGMSLAQLELLRPLFVPYECYEGTVLFEQNEPAEFLYLVITGEMMIQYKPDDGPALTVARVRPGGLVGWSALIGRRFYTSGVMCTTHATMLRVNGADLQKLCEQDPKTGVVVLERLADVIAERLRNTQPQVLSLLEKSIRSGLKC
jgi:toluene monooxygenase system ferredoxin subunit